MYSIYEVKGNESISDIAKKLNVSVEDLIFLNGEINNVTQGQLIIIPSQKEYTIYSVKKGDNLNSIAREYNVDAKSIALLNGLKEGEYIYPNQKLLIPKMNVYITKENETLSHLLDVMSLDEVLNNKIYLQSDQILFYKKN